MYVLSGVRDPLKEHLVEVMFSKPYTVCNLHKLFTCMFVVDNISYITLTTYVHDMDGDIIMLIVCQC